MHIYDVLFLFVVALLKVHHGGSEPDDPRGFLGFFRGMTKNLTTTPEESSNATNGPVGIRIVETTSDGNMTRLDISNKEPEDPQGFLRFFKAMPQHLTTTPEEISNATNGPMGIRIVETTSGGNMTRLAISNKEPEDPQGFLRFFKAMPKNLTTTPEEISNATNVPVGIRSVETTSGGNMTRLDISNKEPEDPHGYLRFFKINRTTTEKASKPTSVLSKLWRPGVKNEPIGLMLVETENRMETKTPVKPIKPWQSGRNDLRFAAVTIHVPAYLTGETPNLRTHRFGNRVVDNKINSSLLTNSPGRYDPRDTTVTVCMNRSTIYGDAKVTDWIPQQNKSNNKSNNILMALRRLLYSMGNSEECHNRTIFDASKYMQCSLRRHQRLEYMIPFYPGRPISPYMYLNLTRFLDS